MKLDIVTLPNDELREVCKEIKEFDAELENTVKYMFETLSVSNGIGLAAPQVNIPKRFFIVKIEDGEERVFVNPEITDTSATLVPYEEGCLSVPGVFSDVMRPDAITVYAQDVQGKRFKLEATGLLARVIQHENDHLNGKLFIDRVSNEQKQALLSQYEKKNKRSKFFHGRKK